MTWQYLTSSRQIAREPPSLFNHHKPPTPLSPPRPKKMGKRRKLKDGASGWEGLAEGTPQRFRGVQGIQVKNRGASGR